MAYVINKQFHLEIEDIEEDYPDHAAEYRMQALEDGLIDFAHRVANEYTASVEEENVLLFEIAMRLLGRFQSKERTKLLHARLMARVPA